MLRGWFLYISILERTCGGDHSLLEREQKNQCKTQFCINFSCIKKKWKSMFGHSSKATPFIKYESICYHKVVLKAMHWTQRCKGYKYQSRKCTVLKLQSQQMSRPLPQMITLHPVGQICISLEISSRMKKELSNKQRKKKLRKTTEKAGCETLVIL